MSPAWEAVWRRYERAHWSQAASTTANRRGTLLGLVRWLAAEDSTIGPAEVTRTHLNEYLSMEEGTRQGVGILNVHSDLAVIWRWYAGEFRDCSECQDPATYRQHSCRLNPMHGVRRPSVSKHRSRVVPIPTANQLDDVLAALSGRTFLQIRDRALVLLLLESGIRRAEAASLMISDLDLSGRGGGIVHVRDGKNHSDRHTVFGPDAALALSRLIDKHPANQADSAVSLFTKSNGQGPLSAQSIGVIVARAGRAAGVDLGRNLAPHQMRHAWADAHYRQGTGEAIMRSLGGWHGSIPSCYGAANAEERAITVGLASPVMNVIKGRKG